MEIGCLTKLTKLNLNHNKINTLPNEFYNLKELQILSLSHNQLQKVSSEMSDLVMLKQLVIMLTIFNAFHNYELIFYN